MDETISINERVHLMETTALQTRHNDASLVKKYCKPGDNCSIEQVYDNNENTLEDVNFVKYLLIQERKCEGDSTCRVVGVITLSGILSGFSFTKTS